MKTGRVIKSVDEQISAEELQLINKYTRRELNAEEVYVFSVVLCDNDIDRDYERFTVESLFELEKLFVGKTGIFDHNMSAKTQTARIFKCYVETVDGMKTATGDDYFRLVARAYLPKSEKNSELILSLDSGITKEVSVGCAVKHTLCSICSQEIHSPMCHHTKGVEYDNKLCFGELVSPYDAYEFSFVAVPAQKNAGVIKAFSNTKEEKMKMKDILLALKNGDELSLKSHQSKGLCEYIDELKKKALDGDFYREDLKKNVLCKMCTSHPLVESSVLKGILDKLSVKELRSLLDSYTKKSIENEEPTVQLYSDKAKVDSKKTENKEFTI